MTIRTKAWPSGVPCWADLSANDPVAAAAFYDAVLGWSPVDSSFNADGYLIRGIDGHPAAGIGTFGSPGWILTMAADDVDATVALTTAAGGSVLGGPTDVSTAGRVAVLADPTGAPFAVWQARDHIGASWVNGPGGISWEDLRSPDPVASREFFAAVFGWKFDLLFNSGDGDYGTVSNPDAPHPVGGIGPLWGSPAGWLVYFGVVDVDVAVTAVLAGGGSVVSEAHDSPYGRMAQVADPEGAVFAVFTPPADAPQPER